LSHPEHRVSLKGELFAVGGILLLALCIILPVFLRGFPAGFDAVRHFRWTSQFIDALADGAFYPRWLPSANDGQGSPAILYYPPLPFYVAAGFSLLIRDTLTAMAASCWLALGLSGLAMYAFSRSQLSRGFGFLAATLYMMAPYHLLDLYQGSSVSEFWSFVWLPLVFDAIRRASRTRGLNAVAYLASVYALLVMTHVPVLFLTSLTLVLYALLVTRGVEAFLRVGVGIVLGIGLGGIFLLPVLFETRYVKLFFKFDYHDYFLFEHIRTALTSPRFPADGTPFTYLLDNELIAVGTLALFLASALLAFSRRKITWCCSIPPVAAFSIFMTTRLSAPIWSIIPGLSYLFFPYRWLTVASVGTSLLAACCFQALTQAERWRLSRIVVLVMAVVANLAISGLVIMRAANAPESLAESLSRRDPREYRPIWWDGQLQREKWQNAAVVANGDASVQSIDERGIEQAYNIKASEPSLIELRPLYFPGWVARIDSKKTELMPSPEGHVQLVIGPGEQTLSLKFEDTWPRTAGKSLFCRQSSCCVG
jgi:uncharacterized membrane protein